MKKPRPVGMSMTKMTTSAKMMVPRMLINKVSRSISRRLRRLLGKPYSLFRRLRARLFCLHRRREVAVSIYDLRFTIDDPRFTAFSPPEL